MNRPEKDRKHGRIRWSELPVEALQVSKDQPRQDFSPEELESLAESIRQNGILQPLLVCRREEGYRLIAGERRLRAARLAGLRTVPCRIAEFSEEEAAICALVENLQRQDLSYFEEAEGIARLIHKYGLTQAQAARRLGRQQSTCANKLRLLRFSLPERQLLQQYALSERHARALIRVEEEKLRTELLRQAGEKGLTVAQTEQLVERALSGEAPPPSRRPVLVIKDVRIFFNTVSRAVALMRSSGVEATEERRETEDALEYIVRIPKRSACRPA